VNDSSRFTIMLMCEAADNTHAHWLQEHYPRLDSLGVPQHHALAVAAAVARATAAPSQTRDDLFALRSSSVVARTGAAHAASACCVVSASEAAQRSSSPSGVGSAFWLDVVPLQPDAAGTASFAVLPPLLARMRHSATPTHRVAALALEPGALPLCIAWPVGERATGSPPWPEATRDYLAGRYGLTAPLLRALQLIPLLPNPARWVSPAERRHTRASLRDWASEQGQRAERARARAEAASAAAGRMPPSASGRQVFLAWLAQQVDEEISIYIYI